MLKVFERVKREVNENIAQARMVNREVAESKELLQTMKKNVQNESQESLLIVLERIDS